MSSTTSELIRYDAACRALAELRSVDEVKSIRDKAIAMKVYAKQAKDHSLEADAAAIRMRASRRLGEIIKEQRNTVGLATGGDARKVARGKQNPEQKPTLTEAGIDKNLAKEARRLEKLSEKEFEQAVDSARLSYIVPKKSKANGAARGATKMSAREKREAGRRQRQQKINQANDRSLFLRNADSARGVAKYDGVIDGTVLKNCRAVIEAWTKLLTKLETRYAEES